MMGSRRVAVKEPWETIQNLHDQLDHRGSRNELTYPLRIVLGRQRPMSILQPLFG
jgi:hypothetical protein